MISFTDLQDDAALMSLEYQLRLFDVVGLAAWKMNLDEARFELTSPDNVVTSCTDVQILGTSAPGPQSWLWVWADPSGYREDILRAANEARAFGERHGIPELTTPEVPFASLPGSPTDPVAAASLMMEATKAATGRYTGYAGEVGGGTRAGFLLDHPDFRLPEPEFPRFSRVLQQGTAELRFYNQRRGIVSYAQRRGYDIAHNGPVTRISCAAASANIRFDEQNRIVAMSINNESVRVPTQTNP
ncbi:DUF6882 domain-containing protein [Kibdelosporangium phytohabitans]|uniref:Uncharacterized protein n=1 Tax=Kibdelosporangium phytohabitans TaxID=860235 RepID=A0A0N9I7W6_9PSEU|nr:DUF6882 domain-containing protein [Kibdelosporangium phytohabitans]ALG10724.1 hypothetical protein AOZ06_30935 [Kibdelosporangium phytohabitans]MBE1461863.1 hypothetical protein [Kibdelosporangium phytohabitans]